MIKCSNQKMWGGWMHKKQKMNQKNPLHSFTYPSQNSHKKFIRKEHFQTILNNTKKQANWLKNGQDLSRHLYKEDIEILNKHMKKCSTSLIIKEKQIKTTLTLTLVRMATMKKSTNIKCWWGCGEKNTLVHSWWECKLVQPV